jgi:hypothetical protein
MNNDIARCRWNWRMRTAWQQWDSYPHRLRTKSIRAAATNAHAALRWLRGELWRGYAKGGIKSDYVFLNERGQPFGRMGIGRMIERACEAAKLPFPVHVPHADGIRTGGPRNGYQTSSTTSGMPPSRTQ